MPGKHKLESLPQKDATLVEPLECLSVSKLPEGSQWLWEIKLDGQSPGALFPKQNLQALSFGRLDDGFDFRVN